MKRFEGFQKGVNLGGWISQYYRRDEEYFNTFITEEDIEEIAALGFDHVRVPVDYNVLEDEEGNVLEAGFKHLEDCRRWCADRGLNMLIDLHECYGYSFDPLKDMDRRAFFYDEALQARFLDLWREIAERFKDHADQIAFEPLNEIVLYDVAQAWNDLAGRYIKLMRSSDGSTWEEVGPANFSKLLGASQEQLFALGYDALLYASSDDGLTWDLESLDDDVTLLPSQDISIISTPLVTDGAMERVILLGNRDVSVYPDDNKSVIWVKIQDPAKKTGQWMLVGNAYPAYELPRLNHLAVVPYADGLMALGAEGLGACANEAFSQFYLSNDLGLTWEDDSRLLFPTGFRSGSIFAMTVDTDHYIWLLCTESGQVWRGRLNEEGWEDVEKAITE